MKISDLKFEKLSWPPFVAIAALAACLFTIRLTAPPNLLDQDQENPAAYVLDAVKNGNWICQRDLSGEITSKPPLYTWICAVVTLACGRINLFALYLPGALAALGTAWLVLAAGRRHFGNRAGWLAALATMLTAAGLKEFGLARTDGVFAFTVTAAALLGFRAWSRGGGWTWFWLMAAAATLTKGPLGLVLAGGGLAACWWEKRSGQPLPLRGSHLAGLGLFLLITVGWFLLAYRQFGAAVSNKMIFEEFVGQATGTTVQTIPGTHIYQQPLYYLARAAPWSLLAYYGLWRVWKWPATETRVRRFERFLFCWFLVGLAIFSIAPHQRADHLWPLMPAGALIAGRELERLAQGLRPSAFHRWVTLTVVVIAGGFSFYYFGPRARRPVIRATVALERLAEEIERRGGKEFPLTHVDDPVALQIYLNTLCPRITSERAAQLLRGPEPAFVAITDLEKLQAARQPDDPPIYTLLPSPGVAGRSPASIMANRPGFVSADPIAFCFGSLFVRASGARLVAATERGFWFTAIGKSAEVLIVNEASAPRKVRVCILESGAEHSQQRVLAKGETWRMVLP